MKFVPTALRAKKLLSLAMVLAVLLSLFNAPAFAADEVPAAEERSMVPLRSAVESAGGSVTWNEADRSIVIRHEKLSAALTLQKADAVVNGAETVLDFVPSTNAAGRTLVPYDFLRPILAPENSLYTAALDYAIPRVYSFMELTQTAGMTMSFVDMDSETAWTQGFGYAAEVQPPNVVTEDTQFEIGSITKTFTAMAIMQLQEKGLLDIDNPLTDYLKDFKINPHPDYGGDYADITLRMLGQHTSGIPGTYVPHFMNLDASAYDMFNTVVEDMSALSLSSAPGDTWAYSNMAVTLLGAVIPEIASPESDYLDGYADYIENNIFIPLGMETTSVLPREGAVKSKGFAIADMPMPDVYISAVPAGSIFSTASDMAAYLRALLSGGGDVLSKESMDEMFAVTALEAPKAFGMEMGFVWIPYEYAEGKYIWMHDGETQSFFSLAAIEPESGLGIFISGNTASGGPYVAQTGLDILLKAIEAKTGVKADAADYPETQPKDADAEYLASLEGLYTSGTVFTFKADGAKGLTYEVAGQQGQFAAQDDGSFIDPSDGSRVFFETVDGDVVFGVYNGFKKNYLGEKVTEFGLDYFDGFAGTWQYVNTDNDDYMASLYGSVSIEMQGDYPVVKIGATAAALLVFTDGNTAYIPGFMRGLGEVIRLVKDGDEIFLTLGGAKFSKKQ